MARSDIDQTLAGIPIFSECTRKELKAISRLVTPVSISEGKVLVREGEPGREFMIIVEGTATVRRNGRKVATLGPGNWFGELSLIDNEPRSATVVAVTDMKLLVLGQAEFGGLLETVPSMAAKLLRGIALRLRQADARALTN